MIPDLKEQTYENNIRSVNDLINKEKKVEID